MLKFTRNFPFLTQFPFAYFYHISTSRSSARVEEEGGRIFQGRHQNRRQTEDIIDRQIERSSFFSERQVQERLKDNNATQLINLFLKKILYNFKN